MATSSSATASSQFVSVSSMKVNELRFQLKRRGLSQTGSKDILAERLRGALDGQDQCVISTPNLSRVRSKGERVTKDSENISKEHQDVVKVSQGASRENAAEVSSICGCTNCCCNDVAKAIEMLQGLIQKQTQSFNTFMLSMREEIRSVSHKVNSKSSSTVDTFVAKLAPLIDNINVLSSQVDMVSENLTRCIGGNEDGYHNEYPNKRHSLGAHGFDKWQGMRSNRGNKKLNPDMTSSYNDTDRVRSSGISGSVRPYGNVRAKSRNGHNNNTYSEFMLEGVDSSNSVSVIGRMIEGLYDRTEQIPDFTVKSISRASLTPAFLIQIVPEATQVFLDLWDLKIRKDVGFHLSRRHEHAVHQPTLIVNDNLHSGLDTNDTNVDLTPSGDRESVAVNNHEPVNIIDSDVCGTTGSSIDENSSNDENNDLDLEYVSSLNVGPDDQRTRKSVSFLEITPPGVANHHQLED
jgi:hypothetical protein